MAADVAQYESSNIKCYVSAFSNILIYDYQEYYNYVFLFSSTSELMRYLK